MSYLDRVWIGIISSRRSKNILSLVEKLGIKDYTVYVRDRQDYDEYEKQISYEHLMVAGSITEARNRCISEAVHLCKDCLILEDDIRKVVDRRTNKEIGITEILQEFRKGITELRYMPWLAGPAITTNKGFLPNRDYSINVLINGNINLIRYGAGVYYDTRLTRKEDYDYCMQHISKYGCVLRCENIIVHYNRTPVSDKGIRTPEIEQQNIKILKEKWGNVIQDNTKRENEIMLRLPRIPINF